MKHWKFLLPQKNKSPNSANICKYTQYFVYMYLICIIKLGWFINLKKRFKLQYWGKSLIKDSYKLPGIYNENK